MHASCNNDVVAQASIYMHFMYIARSPVYSHLSLTLQGLTTIRSYSMETSSMDMFHDYMNKHSQAWYLYLATTR